MSTLEKKEHCGHRTQRVYQDQKVGAGKVSMQNLEEAGGLELNQVGGLDEVKKVMEMGLGAEQGSTDLLRTLVYIVNLWLLRQILQTLEIRSQLKKKIEY